MRTRKPSKNVDRHPYVPDTGPFASKEKIYASFGPTLEFKVGNYPGFYMVTVARMKWVSTKDSQ